MKLRLVFVGENDWASCAFRVAQALNAYYGETVARTVVANSHPFGYENDICVQEHGLSKAFDKGVGHLAEGDAAWVFTTGDGTVALTNLFFDRLAKMKTFRTGRVRLLRGAFHIGTAYRSSPDMYDRVDRELGVSVRFISPDSIRLSPDPGVWDLPYCHAIGGFSASYIEPISIPAIVHSPSNRGTKGSDAIEKVVDSLRSEFNFEWRCISGVSYSECVRMREAGHIFIGQLNPAVGGFGYSSVEAAAQGMVPIASQCLTPESVWSDAGLSVPPVLSASDPEELRAVLVKLLKDPNLLCTLRRRANRWAHFGDVSLLGSGAYYAAQLEKRS